MEQKDYYAMLGISSNVDGKEVQKAFRKLAPKYHPDLHPGDKAAEARFKEINEAYQILVDTEKRKKYDETFGYSRQRDTSGTSTNRTQTPEDIQKQRENQRAADQAQYDEKRAQQQRDRDAKVAKKAQDNADQLEKDREAAAKLRPETLRRMYEGNIQDGLFISQMNKSLQMLLQTNPDIPQYIPTLTQDINLLEKIDTEFARLGRGFMKETHVPELKDQRIDTLFADIRLGKKIQSLYQKEMFDLLKSDKSYDYQRREGEKVGFTSIEDFTSFLGEDIADYPVEHIWERKGEGYSSSDFVQVELTGEELSSRISKIVADLLSQEFNWRDFAKRQERNWGNIAWTQFLERPEYVMGDADVVKPPSIPMQNTETPIPIILRTLLQEKFSRYICAKLLHTSTFEDFNAYLRLLSDQDIDRGTEKSTQNERTNTYYRVIFDNLIRENGKQWKGMMKKGLFGLSGRRSKEELVTEIDALGFRNTVFTQKVVEILQTKFPYV